MYEQAYPYAVVVVSLGRKGDINGSSLTLWVHKM